MVEQTRFVSFGTVLADGEFWASLGRTVIIAGASATIASVAATVLAYGIARGRRTVWTKSMDLFASSSVAIPTVIAGFALFLTFMVINPVIPLAGTMAALIIAYSFRVSVAYRAGYSATLQIRKELEEAAVVSGASQFEGFRKIIVPLLMPTVFAVWIQMFILGTNEFTLPAFLATPETRPLSVYMYAMINPRSAQLYAPDQGAAMALIFTLFVFVIGYGLQWAVSFARDRSSAASRDSLSRSVSALDSLAPPRRRVTRHDLGGGSGIQTALAAVGASKLRRARGMWTLWTHEAAALNR